MKRRIRKILIPFYSFLRDIRPPGFHGVGLYDVFRFFFKGIFNAQFNLMASAIAYNFFFSLFPTLILLFTLLPYIPVNNLQEQIMEYVKAFVPLDSMGLVDRIVKASFQKMGIGVIVLNIILILQPSLRGIIAMMNAFKKPDDYVEKETVFHLYGKAILIFLILNIFLILSIVFLNIGIYLINYGKNHHIIGHGLDAMMFSALNYGITLLLLLFSVTMIYFIGGSNNERWRFFSPGSIISAVLLLATLIGLNYYFSNFGNYNKIYGGLATVIILMLWFYYISIVLLLGNELNYSIDKAEKYKRNFKANAKRLS
ncbi:MAG: YihY/virulence factor BrkB family protein [Bacteroidia bacterium]|nr:YihY/virulence factor BrkB family protein [Bacteroidia bacterium]